MAESPKSAPNGGTEPQFTVRRREKLVFPKRAYFVAQVEIKLELEGGGQPGHTGRAGVT